ncbi:hypothetical protein ZEAMMB73_Zm00001d000243 [Zea mays]|nr:hypothetical protein ZEAMMB73_Zm00001d000243 [Zea mays]
MAKEAWGVDGYGSMKGLIRLRADAGDAGGDDSGSGESEVEEHVEVERRLDHDLSRFEMVHLPAAAAASAALGEEDDEARAARLEEENLTLRERLFLMERDMADLRRRLVAVEELCLVDTADELVPSESAAAVACPGARDETYTGTPWSWRSKAYSTETVHTVSISLCSHGAAAVAASLELSSG